MEGNAPPEAGLLGLEQRFVGLAAGYEQAKADAEGRVSSWKWFRSNALDLRPFYFEREGWKPGTPLRHRPNRLRNTVEYGFDTSGNVVVERDYMTDAGACYETFRLQDDPVVELASFDYHDEKNLNSVCHLMYRNDLLRWCALRGRESGWAECYVWSDDQLSRIDVAACEPPARHLDVVAQYSFFYEGGRLREIVYHLPGEPNSPTSEHYRL